MLTGLTFEATALAAGRLLAADGVGESTGGARSWIWAVAAGLLLSAALLAHAGWRAFSALPGPVRAATAGTLRRHPRLLAVQAGIALWTLLYVLYNLAYPTSVRSEGRQLASVATELVPAASAPAAVPPRAARPVAAPLVAPPLNDLARVAARPEPQPAPQPAAAQQQESGAPPSASRSASPAAPPSPSPCQARPASEVLRQLDQPARAVTGRPLGSEAAAVAEQAAGCRASSAGWTLALLSGSVAAPAPAPVTAERCGDVLGQLVLLRVLAPVGRLGTTNIDDALSDIDAACRTSRRHL